MLPSRQGKAKLRQMDERPSHDGRDFPYERNQSQVRDREKMPEIAKITKLEC